MKIIIHSIEELLQLTELVRGGPAAGHIAQLSRAVSASRVVCTPEPDGLPTDICGPVAHVYDAMGDQPTSTAQAAVEDAARADAIAAGKFEDTPECDADDQEFPERDADGAKYSTDWHSDPKKLTAKNVWRAKRGRNEAAYQAWLLEQAVEVAEAALAADAEPVATETHALPEIMSEAEAEAHIAEHVHGKAPAQPASTVNLQALVAASQEAAMDAKDGLQDLLAGCRDFTSAHGTAEFNALKAAVAPRGDTGASLQEFTPAERRLMLACIANYPTKES